MTNKSIPTPDEIWSILREVSISQKELSASQEETGKRIAELSISQKEEKLRMKELREGQKKTQA